MRRALFALAGLAMALNAAAQATPAALRCQLALPAQAALGQPLRLKLTLTNTGAQPLQVLTWATPFDGWFAPYVAVRLEGRDLPYRGPSVKRGEPLAEDFVRLAPGRSRSATVNVAQAFELNQPGSYELLPRIVLFDVSVAARPVVRLREQFEAQPLNCPSLHFRIAPRATGG